MRQVISEGESRTIEGEGSCGFLIKKEYVIRPEGFEPALMGARNCRTTELGAHPSLIWISRVVVASDCQMLIKDIEEGNKWEYSIILAEIVYRQSFFLQECDFIHQKTAKILQPVMK